MFEKKIRKGEIYGEENEDKIRVLKWVDKRAVLMISTVPDHKDNLLPTGKKNRKGEDVIKPAAVLAYNKAKKGVDMSDQMSSYYTSLRKTIKWYRKVFCEISLGTCVVNSWSVHNNYGNPPKKLDMLQVRERIIEGLLNEDDDNTDTDDDTKDIPKIPKKKNKSSSGPIVTHKFVKHPGHAKDNRKRCTLCYKKIQSEKGVKEARAKTKRVCTYCEDCHEKPHMCLPCFNEFHK